ISRYGGSAPDSTSAGYNVPRAATFAAQTCDRQRFDIDTPKRLRGRIHDMNDRCAYDRRMRDNNGSPVARLLISEPSRNTTYEVNNSFAAVRCCGRIAQPRFGGVWLLGDDLAKGLSSPPSVVALAQHRFNARAQSERTGSLTRPQLGTAPARVGAR